MEEAATERDPKVWTPPTDTILNTLSGIPAATPGQDLSWRLTTVNKLDRLGLHGPSAIADFSTEPNQREIVEEIVNLFQYVENTDVRHLRAKIMGITSIAVDLWGALRKDSCQIDFDLDPSSGDWHMYLFEDDVPPNGSTTATPSTSDIPDTQLPSDHFILFPRITGVFDSGPASPRSTLSPGFYLPRDCPAFRHALEEIKHVEHATEELHRKLRRGSSAQTSPAMNRIQGEWPSHHRGYT